MIVFGGPDRTRSMAPARSIRRVLPRHSMPSVDEGGRCVAVAQGADLSQKHASTCCDGTRQAVNMWFADRETSQIEQIAPTVDDADDFNALIDNAINAT